MAELFKIAEARGEKRGNAIFFHGLGGDARTTWQADENDKGTFWPAWLAQDIEGFSVFSVGYEAPVSRWRGSAMHLIDRATNVLGDLLNEPDLANGAFVLIGHSLGGLLIKQILRTVHSEAQNDEKAASFLRRVEKIVFLATPHTGADLAVWGDRLRILVRPSAATACLVRNDPNLRDLNLWYRDWSNHQSITNLVLTETKSLSILGVIVKPDSSDPGLAGPRPRPMDYDHEWICKPLKRTSDIYVAVRNFIESPLERPKDLVAEQLEKLASQQKDLAAQIAREKGIEVAPLLAVLVKLGEKGVLNDDIPKRLDSASDELIKLRAENEILRRGPPALAAIAEEVQTLIDKGDLDASRTELERGRGVSRTLRIDASRYEAAFLAQAARVDELQLAYCDAAAKYGEAAALIAPFDTEQHWRFLLAQASELCWQGEYFGDNSASAEAVEITRQCLALAPRTERPLQWAETQMNLSNGLRLLGELDSGTARLEEAIVAGREALQELTFERVPLQWANTQMYLGFAFAILGGRESGTARFEEAVAAYREALRVQTRERAPLVWANTQRNLGDALMSLGCRGGGTLRLQEAATAYRQALLEFPRSHWQWARTQMSLGLVLFRLGEWENGSAHLVEAISAFREALERITHDRAPRLWTIIQMFLGAALRALGERESGTARLKEAVSAYRDALHEFSRARAPLQWACVQIELGSALTLLGEQESGTARLEEAVAVYQEALQELTRERVPLEWAAAQVGLGNALRALGEREDSPARLEEAVSVIREAMQVSTSVVGPFGWAAMPQMYLGDALFRLGERESGVEKLEGAILAYREALKEWTKEPAPHWQNIAQQNLHRAEVLLARRRTAAIDFE